MARKRRSGAQQRAYKVAKRYEAQCQNERFRRSLAELRAYEREIVAQDYELFQQLQKEAETARQAETAEQSQQEATRQEEQPQEPEQHDSDSDKENNFVLPIGRTRPR